jgi:hypothetical protein
MGKLEKRPMAVKKETANAKNPKRISRKNIRAAATRLIAKVQAFPNPNSEAIVRTHAATAIF